MEVLEAIKGRRSVRRFKGEAVPREVILELLEAVRWAPSWANTQCWEVIVVAEPEKKAALAETLTPGNPAKEAMTKAPWVVVFLGQKGKAGFYGGRPLTSKGDWLMFDVALAVQNLCLAAHARGLGTVIVGAFEAERAAEVLGVPDDREVVVMLPLGVPAGQPSAPRRKEVEDFTHWGCWGKG
ncbi:MAG: nitroreductase [Deltaproteobacteria bacterium]|nr:MAG: nitroreductase [Deltaproteobacteria bacterium]